MPKTTTGFAIGNQLIRSGTSIGANIEEAQNSGSKKEFIHGLTISLKEARETEYWIKFIRGANLISLDSDSILEELIEITKVLTTIIRNSKKNL